MISGSRRSSLYRSIIGGKLATILVAPQQFGSLTVFCDTHDTQIDLGITVNILEILAGAGDDKNLTDDRSGIKAQRNDTDHMIQIQTLPYFLGIQQVADVVPLRSSQPRRYIVYTPGIYGQALELGILLESF